LCEGRGGKTEEESEHRGKMKLHGPAIEIRNQALTQVGVTHSSKMTSHMARRLASAACFLEMTISRKWDVMSDGLDTFALLDERCVHDEIGRN
jgi:hypothetical protein